MLTPLLLLAFAGQVPANRYSSSYIFHACQAEIRFVDNPNAASNDDVRLSATCADWLMGFTEAGALAKFFCPGIVVPATLARVYVAYMEKNPTLLDSPRGTGALLAMVEAYPCPTKPA
jgi:hypothetical protein